MKKQSKADRFAQLFDQDWAHTKSQIRTRVEERVYDPSNSWDARSDDPQSFSRLGQTIVPLQVSKPIVLSGTQVVELQENTGFSCLNVKQAENEKSYIPLTQEQQAVRMQHDLSGKTPLLDAISSSSRNNPHGKTTVIVDSRPGFENMLVKPTQVTTINKPEYMISAGEQTDQRLLNPKQRREIYDLYKKEEEAKAILKKAVLQRQHTKEIMGGPVYRRGVLMVDASDNIASEVYGERATKEFAEIEYKRQIHLERMSKLANKQSSMHTNGNILVPDSLGPRVQVQKSHQSKGGDYHALSFDETHNRLFCRLQGAASSLRTQMLRDTELSGKDYNITQHTTIEHWPARRIDRLVEKDMGHPSQQALEQGRNLQGSFRPV